MLAKVDPRLSTRAAGFAIGTAMLGLFWARAFRTLDRGGPRQPRRRFARHLRLAAPIVARSVLDYFRPGFHPDEHDLDALAREGLERAGIAPA